VSYGANVFIVSVVVNLLLVITGDVSAGKITVSTCW